MSRVRTSHYHKNIELPTGKWVSRLMCPQCQYWRDGFTKQHEIKTCENCGLYMQLEKRHIICWQPSGLGHMPEKPDNPELDYFA